MSDYITEYHRKIQNGTEVVGKWIRLVYERIEKGLAEGSFFYDEAKADAVIDYIEHKCFHTEGKLAPHEFKLELWQKAMLSCIFGIVDKDGLRVHREVFFVVGRKNGKSLLASAIAKYMFMEQSRQDGGYGTRVYCLAPKLDQADIIYNNIWSMITLDPEWQKIPDKDPKKARHRMTDYFLEATNSTVKKIAHSHKKSDGFSPSLAICDEISSWEGDKGLKQWEVIRSGMGARTEPLMFACSTSGYINDSIFDELMKRSTRLLLGDSKETRLLPFIYMIDDPDKWQDLTELKKANPNMGVSITEGYLTEEMAVAETSLSKKSEYLTKYCNIKQNSSLAFLEASVVQDACRPFDIKDIENTYAVAGIDLSRSTDLSCAVILVEKEGIIYCVSQFFMPRGRIEELQASDGVPYEHFVTKGWLTLSGDRYIDYQDVYNWVTNMMVEHKLYIQMCGYDRYSAVYLINDLKAFGIRCDDVWQGDNLWNIILLTEAKLKEKKLVIGDNDLMKSHLLNSAVKMSHERGRGRLIKINPTAHVDGFASILDAMCVRDKWWSEIGERLTNKE